MRAFRRTNRDKSTVYDAVVTHRHCPSAPDETVAAPKTRPEEEDSPEKKGSPRTGACRSFSPVARRSTPRILFSPRVKYLRSFRSPRGRRKWRFYRRVHTQRVIFYFRENSGPKRGPEKKKLPRFEIIAVPRNRTRTKRRSLHARAVSLATFRRHRTTGSHYLTPFHIPRGYSL